MGGGPAVAQQYHIALEESIKKHFPGNDCINCMCHSTENFYRQACCASFILKSPWPSNLCIQSRLGSTLCLHVQSVPSQTCLLLSSDRSNPQTSKCMTTAETALGYSQFRQQMATAGSVRQQWHGCLMISTPGTRPPATPMWQPVPTTRSSWEPSSSPTGTCFTGLLWPSY